MMMTDASRFLPILKEFGNISTERPGEANEQDVPKTNIQIFL